MRLVLSISAACFFVLSACTSAQTADTQTTVDPSTEWEMDCPGDSVRVLYDSSATDAMFTALFPDGIKQGTFRYRLKNTKGSIGLRFCAAVGTPLSLAAQNQNAGGGVTCRIEVDGENVSYQNSEGPYVIAQCTGLA